MIRVTISIGIPEVFGGKVITEEDIREKLLPDLVDTLDVQDLLQMGGTYEVEIS